MGGHVQVVHVLLDAGADVNAKDKHGSTALMMAAGGITENLPVGIEVNTTMISISYNFIWGVPSQKRYLEAAQTEVVSVLLNAGADVNARNKNGRTALWFAKIKIVKKIESLLRKYGAKE